MVVDKDWTRLCILIMDSGMAPPMYCCALDLQSVVQFDKVNLGSLHVTYLYTCLERPVLRIINAQQCLAESMSA